MYKSTLLNMYYNHLTYDKHKDISYDNILYFI